MFSIASDPPADMIRMRSFSNRVPACPHRAQRPENKDLSVSHSSRVCVPRRRASDIRRDLARDLLRAGVSIISLFPISQSPFFLVCYAAVIQSARIPAGILQAFIYGVHKDVNRRMPADSTASIQNQVPGILPNHHPINAVYD